MSTEVGDEGSLTLHVAKRYPQYSFCLISNLHLFADSMAYHPDDLFFGEEKRNFRPFMPRNLMIDEKLFQLLLSLDPQRLEPVSGSEVSHAQRKLQAFDNREKRPPEIGRGLPASIRH